MGAPLLGRLGIDVVRRPHADRHGLLWMERGALTSEAGCLHLQTAGFEDIPAGEYAIPFLGISAILAGPGSTVSHDALRLLGRGGVAFLAIGEGGVRLYSSPPLFPDNSRVARQQVKLWARDADRDLVIRRMYAYKLGEILPRTSLQRLRGMEGARAKRSYEILASQHGVVWKGRCFDRNDHTKDDIPNQCINHAATAMYAAAAIAVCSVGAIPQLGFIHEASGEAFILDIADMFRDSHTLPIAFTAARTVMETPGLSADRATRKIAARRFKKDGLIGKMIDRIKDVLNVDGNSDND